MVHVRYLYDRICDIHQHDTVSTVPQVNKKSTAFKDEDPFTARAPGWRQIAPNCPSSNRSSDDKSLDLGCYPFFSIKFKDKAFQLQDVAGYIFPKSIHAVLYIYIYVWCIYALHYYILAYIHYVSLHDSVLSYIHTFCAEITIFLALFTFNRFHRWIGVRENLQEISWNFPWNMRFLDTFPWTRPLK